MRRLLGLLRRRRRSSTRAGSPARPGSKYGVWPRSEADSSAATGTQVRGQAGAGSAPPNQPGSHRRVRRTGASSADGATRRWTDQLGLPSRSVRSRSSGWPDSTGSPSNPGVPWSFDPGLDSRSSKAATSSRSAPLSTTQARSAQPRSAQTRSAQTRSAQTRSAQTRSAQTRSGKGQPRSVQPWSVQPQSVQSRTAQSRQSQPWLSQLEQPGRTDQIDDLGLRGLAGPGLDGPGLAGPGSDEPELGWPGLDAPGLGLPGLGIPEPDGLIGPSWSRHIADHGQLDGQATGRRGAGPGAAPPLRLPGTTEAAGPPDAADSTYGVESADGDDASRGAGPAGTRSARRGDGSRGAGSADSRSARRGEIGRAHV